MFAVVNIILTFASALHEKRGGRFTFQVVHYASRMVGKEKVKGNTLEAHHNLESGQRRGPGSCGRRVSRGVKRGQCDPELRPQNSAPVSQGRLRAMPQYQGQHGPDTARVRDMAWEGASLSVRDLQGGPPAASLMPPLLPSTE